MDGEGEDWLDREEAAGKAGGSGEDSFTSCNAGFDIFAVGYFNFRQ